MKRSLLAPITFTRLLLHTVTALPLSITSPDVTVTRSYTLHGDGIDNNSICILNEVRPPRRDPNIEEDDVELYYPTTHRAFTFPDHHHHSNKLLDIRQTSFGCGRLGATVWPSAIALSCLLASSDDTKHFIEGKRIMELGSGCGLPSLVAKEVCDATNILATDYWEENNNAVDGQLSFGNTGGDRLVPKDLFGVNLAYNIGTDETASVRHLDWHDEMGIFRVATDFRPDMIIGSDLVYYPEDTPPLLQTLEMLLKAGGAKDALLISPLRPAYSERKALPEFRSQLEKGVLGDGCEVVMDEFEMVGMGMTDDEERHNFLRIRVHSHGDGENA